LRESIAILLDASGSMREDNRMEQAKQSAYAVLRQVTPDTEVALIAFSGCGSVGVTQPFTTNPEDIEAILPNIKPGGSTPLAAATAFGKKYISESARGQSARLVILTDGKDTCGGDPVKAVRSD
jgi:Mg-chelatase subunit ChlD